jgi:hypothetical protein
VGQFIRLIDPLPISLEELEWDQVYSTVLPLPDATVAVSHGSVSYLAVNG